MFKLRHVSAALGFLLVVATSFATPEFVEHVPATSVFGESPSITMREPEIPREDEAVDLWIKIGYSFFYTDVAIYYTTDGTVPSGVRGVPSGSTQVLRSAVSQVTFVRNEPSGSGNIDWWKATLPSGTRGFGTRLRYRIGAWHSSGGLEVFSNNYGCSDNVCNDAANTPLTHEFTNKLAWPGKGSAFVDHQVGYPPVRFWKEEAVAGNNYLNAMLDQNGTLYDVYYPSAGCVQGMGTKNEGYSGGLDTFPPGLPLDHRGQMNINQVMAGIRVDGKTFWMSNQNGGDYTGVAQSYVPNSNVVQTSSTFVGNGSNIGVVQYDFAPKGITFPNDNGGVPNRGLYVKRVILTNHGGSPRTLNFYIYGDFALNGGDAHDVMFTDMARGAMVAYDNVPRFTSSNGEYNPTSFPDYQKSVSVYLAAALKVCNAVGGSAGTAATDSWRDTSSDNGQGWIGVKLTLNPGESRELNFALAGGFDNFAWASGTYAWQTAPALDWFHSTSMQTIQNQTNTYWQNWINEGVVVDTPEQRYDDLWVRSKLGTALHLDGKGGGVVAGMHNGAYPFVWPRDAAYAAVTLARAGHFPEAREVYRFLKDVAYRANDTWGKGFWYQKYTTDGYIVWSAPQVDETAVVPWGVKFQADATGDLAWLQANYGIVYEAARASSEDSSIDSRLYYADPFKLMYSMNVWEDRFDTFIYSNANIERGLRDAASVATRLGFNADATTFTQRANDIAQGVRDRLTWNGENCDISQLGIVYPFQTISPTDPQAKLVMDRINGVATDRWGNNQPLVNFSGEFQNTINRYWGDTYWNGSAWWLTTLWYGLFYAERGDYTKGKGDIDNHKSRIDVLFPFLGPIGFGAEQITPSNSLVYPDFRLQTAYPNAWESMSTYMDSIMAFLDWTPDAFGNTLRIAPKLPTSWPTMTFNNLRMGSHRFNITYSENTSWITLTITNVTGLPCNLSAWIKAPRANTFLAKPTRNGVKISLLTDSVANRGLANIPLATGAGATTTVRVLIGQLGGPPGSP
ncbi:MAG TPA: hypothetical protein PLH94_00225 [Fimbriimonadaceae bacterium]|nr:hypothetical protein [Fimbriimonadaceae bacterium]